MNPEAAKAIIANHGMLEASSLEGRPHSTEGCFLAQRATATHESGAATAAQANPPISPKLTAIIATQPPKSKPAIVVAARVALSSELSASIHEYMSMAAEKPPNNEAKRRDGAPVSRPHN